MSSHKSKNSKNIVIEPQQHSESDSDESDVIEITKKDKKREQKKVSIDEPTDTPKKIVSESKLKAMAVAREAKKVKLQKKREEDEESKKLIERAYHDELEANLTKTMLPKYSKQIKQQILEKLKAKKLEELKKKYNYKSDDSSSDSDSSSDDEVVVRKTSKKKASKEKELPTPKKSVKKEEPPKPKSILQTMREYGF